MKIEEYVKAVFNSLRDGTPQKGTIEAVRSRMAAGYTYTQAVVETALIAKRGVLPTPKNIREYEAKFGDETPPDWLIEKAPETAEEVTVTEFKVTGGAIELKLSNGGTVRYKLS